MKRILDAGLLLLHLDLADRADLHHGDAAGELGQALLQLLAVVVAAGVLDLLADGVTASGDLLLVAAAAHDGGRLLVDLDALGAAEVFEGGAVELAAEVLHEGRGAGEDGDVLEHLLAAVTEARRLDGGDLQRAAEAVDDQGGEGLAVHVLGDDEQLLAALGHRLENRDEVVHGRDLLLVNEDQRVGELDLHLLLVGDEVGREVAAVELHPLDGLEDGLEGVVLLDRDDAFLAGLVHRLGEDLADGGVAVGGDGGDLGDVILAVGGDARLLEGLGHLLDAGVDAALEVHRVVTRLDEAQTFAEEGLGEHGGGGGAVAGFVARLARDLAHHLGAEVLELVLDLDLLGDGDAVLGDRGGAPALLEDHVAALGTERDLHGVGEGVDAAQNGGAGVTAENDLLGTHDLSPSSKASGLFGHREDVVFPQDQVVLALELDLGAAVLAEEHGVADLDLHFADAAVLEGLAVADRDDLTLDGLFLGGVRDDDSTLGGAFALDALDDEAILKRPDVHAAAPVGRCGGRSVR